MTLPIDGRLMSVAEFRQYVAGLGLEGAVQRVVIHHTASPDEATWVKWGGWPYWKLALKRFYEGKGWAVGPHLFVGPEGIGLFYNLSEDGRAVGGGTLEQGSRHIEIVGNYTDHLPSGATLSNAVAAAAALLDARDLPITALTNHDRVVGGWDCPGAELRRQWSWFVGEVAAARIPDAPPEGLPQNEPDGPPAFLMEKIRWHTEQMARELEAGNDARAAAILDGLISLEYGLMYRLERALKAAA